MTQGPILVAGSRGFLGRAFAELLESRGRRAVLVSHAPERGYKACELCDAGAARALLAAVKPAAIVQLAGAPFATGLDLWRAHVTATTTLLEAASRLPKPPRVLVVGSAAEYGDGPGSGPIKESARAHPLSPYGASKLAQTLAALSFRHRGVPVIVARAFNVLGPRTPDRLSLGSFARQIALVERGLQNELRVGNLSAKRDYIDVRDAAEAFLTLLDRGTPGEVYNVCSGRARSTQELLDALLAFARVPVKVVVDPGRRKAADVPVSVGDASCARALGWKPRIPLETSLKDTLSWHRERENGRH